MDETIPQRELRNNIAEVLRRAEAGTEFTITVRGRAVARLGPAHPARRLVDVPADALRELMGNSPVDEELVRDLTKLRAAEEHAEEPWSRR